MIGAKLIIAGLVVAAAMASVSANDLTAGLGALKGGLGGLGGSGYGGGLGGLGDLLGGKKEGEKSVVVPTKSQDKTEVKPSTGGQHKQEGGFLGTKGPTELIELILNPFELCAKIAEHFRLHFDKFFPVVTKGVNFGLELAVQPLVLSLKIIEKVFVPDSCKLKLVCNLAHTMSFSRKMLPKLSDKVLNESRMFKAMSDGIHGDCEAIYQCSGQPKVKDEYKDHHKGHQHEGGHKHEEHKHDDHKHDDYKHDDHKHEEHKHQHGDGYHGEESHGEGQHDGGRLDMSNGDSVA